MKNTTFLAAHDFTVKCESGEVEYKKGDLVDICHTENDDVFISYHEDDGNKVHAFELDVTDVDLFSSILENTILVEEELDAKISYEEMTLDQLLVEEGVDMADLMQFMVEAAYKKAVRGGKVTKVPVRRIKKKMTPKQKATRMKAGKALARNPQAKKQRAKSMAIRKRKGLGESGFIVEASRLFDNSLSTVAKEVNESLTGFFGPNAKVKLTNENKVSVNLFNADEENLKEALESLEVNYIIEGEGDTKVVSFFKPNPSPVVESYYAEASKKEMDDEEDDDDMEEKLADKMKSLKASSCSKKESVADIRFWIGQSVEATDMLEKYVKMLKTSHSTMTSSDIDFWTGKSIESTDMLEKYVKAMKREEYVSSKGRSIIDSLSKVLGDFIDTDAQLEEVLKGKSKGNASSLVSKLSKLLDKLLDLDASFEKEVKKTNSSYSKKESVADIRFWIGQSVEATDMLEKYVKMLKTSHSTMTSSDVDFWTGKSIEATDTLEKYVKAMKREEYVSSKGKSLINSLSKVLGDFIDTDAQIEEVLKGKSKGNASSLVSKLSKLLDNFLDLDASFEKEVKKTNSSY
jgi:hypothetical protein